MIKFRNILKEIKIKPNLGLDWNSAQFYWVKFKPIISLGKNKSEIGIMLVGNYFIYDDVIDEKLITIFLNKKYANTMDKADPPEEFRSLLSFKRKVNKALRDNNYKVIN